jgi:hypothetical protein
MAWLICSMPEVCSWLAERDLAHDVRHAAHAAHDLFHRAARFFRPACVPALRPCSTESPISVLDFLGCCRRALRQAAHFRCDDREAAALFTGTRGFHRGVQRQDVGLERDAVDHADDVDDLLGRRMSIERHGVARPGPPRSPPRTATSEADTASWLAWRALSAFCFTVDW